METFLRTLSTKLPEDPRALDLIFTLLSSSLSSGFCRNFKFMTSLGSTWVSGLPRSHFQHSGEFASSSKNKNRNPKEQVHRGSVGVERLMGSGRTLPGSAVLQAY